ncbi:MAG: family 78 glycoside hydrolase catalytic domain [Verrucomicrobiota bacterium JB025]|nr:family 78 glycoside hydrolase catalytic domain [Verrucomicrobiota bacterium JB025]
MKAILTLLAAFALPAAAGLTPVDLQCEGKANPLAATATPELSWRVESDERSQFQTHYQILVASTPELLARDKGDLWDSGKTEPGRSPFVAYAGAPLKAGQSCHWKIRSWDKHGEASPWSEPAVWEVAPTTPADWQGAQWIDDGKSNPTKDEDFYKPDPAPLMRREFSLAKPVAKARLHVAGLGLCMPSVNGERVADHVFDPPWTNFDKRILFRTHDVTKQLTDGSNCLGITLGNGWYNPLPLRMWSHRNIRASIPTGRPRAIALLEVEFTDGSKQSITTGPDWTTTTGPTLRNSIYLGEERDARLAIPGWNTPGFDAKDWKPVHVTTDPLEPLMPLAMPPARTLEPIPAVAVTTPQPGTHIVDFGKNFTGIPEITLTAPAGTRVLFRFGEILNPDGTLNPLTSVCGQIKGMRKDKDGNDVPKGGPGAPEIAWQQDVYITRGGDTETFRPDFTYHGFRYMEVTGLPAAPATDDCVAFPLHTDLAPAGSFSSSNPRLNDIQEITTNTFLANVVTVQSDCPHRERFGYGGDIVATSEAYLMNFDMSGFYAKTVRDWADAARPDGRFTDTAPFVGIDYCGIGWAMTHPLLVDQLYQHYGDRSLLDEQLPAALRWFYGEADRRKNGLVTTGLGDHEALVRARGPVLSTPMFVDTARRIARLARVVGNETDAKKLDALADESAAAWKTEFLKNGKVADGTQTNQLFALGFGAAPADARTAIFDHLVADLTAPEDSPRLTTGIFGTRILLEELSQNGRSDLAYALANRNTFPSWGWMLENGATTLWEHWAGSDGTFSHSHPMFGSVSAWFYRWLGGIQPAPGAVGFDTINIRPQPVGDLTWVKTTHQSVRGPVISNWQVENGTTTYDITIPANTTAIVELPAKDGETLTESGKPIADSGLKLLPTGNGTHKIAIGSGTYQFVTSKG